MTRTPEQRIRIYKKNPDGNLHDAGEDFCVSDFCGVVPRVGDFIVSRWLRDSSEEGRVWFNRTIHVVEAVYYRPDKRTDKRTLDADDSWVVLVVHDRQMKEEEAELL